MGFGLRFREKVKQVGKKSSQPDKNGFMPTTYERVQLTYDEAASFAESLKVIRKRIVDSHTARTKMLKDVEKTLIGTLPKVHEIDPVTGEHNTIEAAPENYGGSGDYVHQGTLTRLTEENDLKVQAQVLDPIDKWISEVDLFKKKVKVLENLRLELDGSRRDHVTIEKKIEKQEAKQAEVDAKHTTHIQSKDASVAGKRTAFEQYEAQLYEELVNIIGETGVLHTALDRAIKLEIEIYQRAADPISTTTARLEQLSTATTNVTSPVSSSQYAPSGASAGATFSPHTSAGGSAYPSAGGSAYPSAGGSAYPSTGASAYPSTPTSTIPGTGAGGVNVYHATTTAPQATGGQTTGPAGGQTTGSVADNVAYERPYAA